MIDDKDILLIEEYLDGHLKGDSLQLFENRLTAEPKLAKELNTYREVNIQLEATLKANKKAEWSEILQQTDTTVREPKVRQLPTSRRRPLYYIASAAAAILLLATFFFLMPQSNSALADQYWGESSAFFSTLTERGNSSADDREVAFKHFQAKQYQQTLNILNNLGQLTEEDRLLQGACYFNLQQYNQSATTFQQLLDDPAVLSKDEARWCLALSYLKQDKTTPAKQLLEQIIEQQAWNWKPATSLLKSLD